MRDEAWFETLYRAHHGAVLAYARRRGAEADDVVAEVFATAWRRRERIPESPLPWLFGVAHNCVLHAQRASARRVRLTGRLSDLVDDAPDDVDRAVDAASASDQVLSALARLPVGDQEILRLSAWEELDPATIAVVLGCLPGTARVRLHRARRRLEQQLARTSSNLEHQR